MQGWNYRQRREGVITPDNLTPALQSRYFHSRIFTFAFSTACIISLLLLLHFQSPRLGIEFQPIWDLGNAF